MNVTLTKTQITRLKSALLHAIDYEENFINAHRTQWVKGPEAYRKEKVIPKDHMRVVAESRRRIEGWIRLIAKLTEDSLK